MKLKTKDIVITTLQRENREISRDELFKLSNISDKASYNLAISELQEDGDIILIKNKNVVLSEAMGYVKATILRSSRYFSFARTADGSPDIFIPCEKMEGRYPRGCCPFARYSPRGKRSFRRSFSHSQKRRQTYNRYGREI